jgi:hypothetical protein
MSESGPPERASLANALQEEEARLRRPEAERADAKARADAREAPLVRSESVAASAAAPLSPTEKAKLFRQLFRGRDDLYPTRFVSKKTAKAAACANKFVAGGEASQSKLGRELAVVV